MAKVKSVTIEFDFDKILKGVFIDSKNKDVNTICDRLFAEKSIRDWYMENYPDDDMGKNLSSLTWYSLLLALRESSNAVSILRVEDSLVRERCFGHLAELMGVPYDVIYYLWLRTNCNY